LLFQEPNPAPVKALLAYQGLISNELRLPLTVATPCLSEQLVQTLHQLETALA